ncbi:HAD family hydrolase [Vagococcus hydrophili]|uniref:HAD family hydrolase n=1 Tax=Vagococcus hydrophili TaxID=2714947 RepID=A0A6G8AVW3_9ENTE|nr:HAD family hydrolase [Vagococcus hydrophili]QIL49208.1 HAD family hydrolase [Vagococcus hydrophili]
MKEISWICFDVGETLVDEKKSYLNYATRCRHQLATKNIEVSPSTYLKMIENNYKQNEKRPLYATWEAFNSGDQRPKWQHVNESLYPDVRETLHLLSRKYKLGVIANQGVGLKERLTSFEILDYFSLIVSSSDVNIKKPDPEIFKIALEKANVKASSAVYIGDRVDNDMIPAKQLGMKTIRIKQGMAKFQSESLLYPSDFIISDFSELLDIL